jgi:hypothetical protein
MGNPFDVSEPERRSPTLQDLRADLAATEWDLELTPAFEPIPNPSITQEQKQGFFGEDLMARTAVGRGEIILDYASGIEDTNKGGADLVTLAEKDGKLCVVLYDNKALSSDTVKSVTALQEHRDANIARLKANWETIVADEQGRKPAEIALFKEALACVDDRPPRVDLVVTNHNSVVTGLSNKIQADGIRFEDMAGNLSASPGTLNPGTRVFR